MEMNDMEIQWWLEKELGPSSLIVCPDCCEPAPTEEITMTTDQLVKLLKDFKAL